MAHRWEIRIGTRTTPRKQSAIRAALGGALLQRHYDYVQPVYQAALFWRLRNILSPAVPDNEVTELAEDCINDAFTRIKEYDALKQADPAYKFRSFLVKKIVFPALKERFQQYKKEQRAMEIYFAERHARRHLETGFRAETAKEFVRSALLQLKETDEISYEVYVRRYFQDRTMAQIYEELKEIYPLSINSVDAVKKKHKRAFDKLKHLFRELVRHRKYIDDDLPFNRYIIHKLHAETTKR